MRADFEKMEKQKNSDIAELKRKLIEFEMKEIKQEDLKDPLKEKNKHIHNLEKKVSKLEEALDDHRFRLTEIKRERTKLEKDFRKVKKKLDQKVEDENLEEDEIIENIPLGNSYAILGKLNDEEIKDEIFKYDICENGKKRTNLMIHTNNTNG